MSIPAEFGHHGSSRGRVAQDAARLSPSGPRLAPSACNHPTSTMSHRTLLAAIADLTIVGTARAGHCRCGPNIGRGDPQLPPRRAGFSQRRLGSGGGRRSALGRDVVESVVLLRCRMVPPHGGQGEAAGEMGGGSARELGQRRVVCGWIGHNLIFCSFSILGLKAKVNSLDMQLGEFN
jgi:hypothetical protein